MFWQMHFACHNFEHFKILAKFYTWYNLIEGPPDLIKIWDFTSSLTVTGLDRIGYKVHVMLPMTIIGSVLRSIIRSRDIYL